MIYLTKQEIARTIGTWQMNLQSRKLCKPENPASPKTLQEAILFYANPARCLELLIELRWPEGVVCPYCQVKDVTFMASVRRWQCKNKACRKQFSIKAGTVMEDRPIGLDKWLCAIWLITNAKNGISSYEIHRAIGVTQKTAWFLLHRIRLAMQSGTLEKMSGIVEADETFLAGLEKNKHESKKLHARRKPLNAAFPVLRTARCQKSIGLLLGSLPISLRDTCSWV